MSPLFVLAVLSFGAAAAICVVIPVVIEVQARRRVAKFSAPKRGAFRPILLRGGKPQAPPETDEPESRSA